MAACSRAATGSPSPARSRAAPGRTPEPVTVDALAPLYPWTKALHLIAVIAWMAALLYLPRLYVYHSQVPAGGAQSALFQTMERRLMRGIMNPAMIAVWLLGITLVLTPGVIDWRAGWWHTKLLSV